MGYFSWLTADSKKSIRVNKKQKVYLLQPNGKPPIEESWYEGYGEFGGVDAYDWLADVNLPADLLKKAEALEIEKRLLGIYVCSSDSYIGVASDGKKYCYAFTPNIEKLFPDVVFFVNYESKINDSTPNKLLASGEWQKMPMGSLVGGIKYPLKFSFDKNAKYEELTESADCPSQGYF